MTSTCPMPHLGVSITRPMIQIIDDSYCSVHCRVCSRPAHAIKWQRGDPTTGLPSASVWRGKQEDRL